MILEAGNTAVDFNLSPLEFRVLTDLQKVAQIVHVQGYVCRAYSPKSIDRFRALPEDKKELLAIQLQGVISLVATCSEVEIPAHEHPEKIFVEYAIKLNNLEMRDKDFWGRLQKDDVIEVYSAENIQLFRTFNFFKISSYSLLDLLTLEWFLLWERPSFALNGLIQAAKETIQGKMKTATQINSPRHILKEIYNDDTLGFKCSSVLVDPGLICPLYETDSDQVKGFLFTLRGKVMGYDSDVDKIAII